MKVVIFYQPDSEHSRGVDEFVHEFGRRYPGESITLINPDSVQGSQEAEIYDIVKYPTVLAISNDGSTLQRWDTGMLPLMNEVAYFANQ